MIWTAGQTRSKRTFSAPCLLRDSRLTPCGAEVAGPSSTSARLRRLATAGNEPVACPRTMRQKPGFCGSPPHSPGWLRKSGSESNCLVPDWIARPDLQAYVDSLSPEQKLNQAVPKRLTTPAEIANAVLRLARDESLAGRVLVWQSDDEPRLIPWADCGYAALDEPFQL